MAQNSKVLCDLEDKKIDRDDDLYHLPMYRKRGNAIKFETAEQFENWKRGIEEEDGAFFIVRSSKMMRDCKKSYFGCSRSGHSRIVPEEQRKRRLKMQGSRKINGTCPARFAVRFSKQGIFVTNLHREHSGHGTELIHLPIPPPAKRRIASMIAARVPFDDILDITQSESTSETSRVRLLNKQDLRNIAAGFSMKAVEGCDSNWKKTQESSDIIEQLPGDFVGETVIGITDDMSSESEDMETGEYHLEQVHNPKVPSHSTSVLETKDCQPNKLRTNESSATAVLKNRTTEASITKANTVKTHDRVKRRKACKETLSESTSDTSQVRLLNKQDLPNIAAGFSMETVEGGDSNWKKTQESSDIIEQLPGDFVGETVIGITDGMSSESEDMETGECHLTGESHVEQVHNPKVPSHSTSIIETKDCPPNKLHSNESSATAVLKNRTTEASITKANTVKTHDRVKTRKARKETVSESTSDTSRVRLLNKQDIRNIDAGFSMKTVEGSGANWKKTRTPESSVIIGQLSGDVVGELSIEIPHDKTSESEDSEPGECHLEVHNPKVPSHSTSVVETKDCQPNKLHSTESLATVVLRNHTTEEIITEADTMKHEREVSSSPTTEMMKNEVHDLAQSIIQGCSTTRELLVVKSCLRQLIPILEVEKRRSLNVICFDE